MRHLLFTVALTVTGTSFAQEPTRSPALPVIAREFGSVFNLMAQGRGTPLCVVLRECSKAIYEFCYYFGPSPVTIDLAVAPDGHAMEINASFTSLRNKQGIDYPPEVVALVRGFLET